MPRDDLMKNELYSRDRYPGAFDSPGLDINTLAQVCEELGMDVFLVTEEPRSGGDHLLATPKPPITEPPNYDKTQHEDLPEEEEDLWDEGNPDEYDEEE